MEVTTTLTSASGEVRIERLFEVVFVERAKRGKHAVTVYTALIGCAPSGTGDWPRLTMTQKIKSGSDWIFPEVTDVTDEFLSRTDIISQFWGDDLRRCLSVDELAECASLEGQPDLARALWEWPDKRRVRTHALVMSRPQGEPGSVIALPFTSLSRADKSKELRFPKPPPELEGENPPKLVALATWSRSTFEVPANNSAGVVELGHSVDWSHASVEELRVYYVFPGDAEIVHQHGTLTVRDSSNHRQEVRSEVNKVYSQPFTLYFGQWEQRGVSAGTIFRVHNSPSLESACRDHAAAQLTFALTVTDADILRKRAHWALLASIAIGAAIAVGAETDRDAIAAGLLPFERQTTLLLWWTVICVAQIPLLVPPLERKWLAAKWLGFAGLALATCWTLGAFMVDERSRPGWFATVAPTLPILVAVLGVLTLVGNSGFTGGWKRIRQFWSRIKEWRPS